MDLWYKYTATFQTAKQAQYAPGGKWMEMMVMMMTVILEQQR